MERQTFPIADFEENQPSLMDFANKYVLSVMLLTKTTVLINNSHEVSLQIIYLYKKICLTNTSNKP